MCAVFYFQFSGGTGTKQDKEKADKSKQATEKAFQSYSQLRVAYVDIDSLLNDYQMYIDKRDEFVEDQSNSQAELQNRSQQLQQEFQDLQQKLNKGLITRAKARMMQQELGQKEQQLYQLRNNLTSQLAEKEQVIYRQVLNSVMDFMEDYADEHNYHYVLSYSFGGPVLYSAEKFNVTQDVVKGLNQEYTKQQNEK